MPDMLDLSSLRGNGLQPTEELLPESAGSEIPPIVYNFTIFNQLIDIGFPSEACKRALYFTENRGLEVATNWLMEHIGDSDFADLFVPPGIDAKPGKVSLFRLHQVFHIFYILVCFCSNYSVHIILGKDKFMVNEDAVAMVKGMGFTREQAVKALKATDNNLERAADWIFSHQAELDALEVEDESRHSEEIFRDGSHRTFFVIRNNIYTLVWKFYNRIFIILEYKLVGFISHMGTSTMVGHYVCHLLKDDQWVIYNDDKVCIKSTEYFINLIMYLYKSSVAGCII